MSLSALGDEDEHEIHADHVMYRKRVSGGGLLTYHSLADLVIENGSLSIRTRAATGFAEIPGSIARLLPDRRADEDEARVSLSETSHEALPGVTRLVLEHPRFVLESSTASATLASTTGRFDIRSETLELSGDVRIRTGGARR